MTRIFFRALNAASLLCILTAPFAYAQGEDLPGPASTWLSNRAYTQQDLYDVPSSDTPYEIESQKRETSEGQRLYRDRYHPPENDLGRTFQDEKPQVPPSVLEEMYSRRADEKLEQFGYDLFTATDAGKDDNDAATPPMGAVQDAFVLGIGDEVQITFTGQRTDQQNYKINSEGLLIIADLPPLPAAGRTMGDVRSEIDSAIASLHNTRAYIALTSVRQIGVLVVGQVHKPGRQNLTVFHSVLDALNASGGIKKTGTMREIRLVRQGRTQIIDLYDLLLHGTGRADSQLRDGDRIIVQSIGPTVAVTGDIKHPGIFEVRQNKYAGPKNIETLSLNDILSLSGGILAPGQNRFIHLALDTKGRENASEINDTKARIFSDGSILSVKKAQERRAGMVELVGNTRRPGVHDLTHNRNLSTLLDSPDVLGPDIYPLIGIIERWNPETFSRIYLDFSVRSVSERTMDIALQESDRIILLGKTEIANLNQEDKPEPEKIEKIGYAQVSDKEYRLYAQENKTIRKYLINRTATLTGEVMNPGLYPVSGSVTLDQVLAVAGGMTRAADPSALEITAAAATHHNEDAPARAIYDLSVTPPENIPVRPGDSIRIASLTRPAELRTVVIRGEVTNPGPYDILPGDRISDLLNRAGGLTQQAYPKGAIFSRESQRKAEKLRFRASAQDMKRALASAIEREKNPPDARQIEMVRELARELEDITPLGRITVEADPHALNINPELDMLLEPGDRLYIPRRPLTVRVDGEVLSPASLQFRKDKEPRDYIREAGGFTYNADKDRAFVIFPDGSAQPLKVSLWRHSADMIPPGSTIIVPRDPKPFDFIESAKDVSQILSNLAITAIFIDDIRD